MTIRVVESNRARALWREILDRAQAGTEDVVVERYGKPVAAVIAYEDFVALQDEIDELRAARRAGAAYEEYKQDPNQAVSYEAFRAEIVTEGLLDE